MLVIAPILSLLICSPDLHFRLWDLHFVLPVVFVLLSPLNFTLFCFLHLASLSLRGIFQFSRFGHGWYGSLMYLCHPKYIRLQPDRPHLLVGMRVILSPVCSPEEWFWCFVYVCTRRLHGDEFWRPCILPRYDNRS